MAEIINTIQNSGPLVGGVVVLGSLVGATLIVQVGLTTTRAHLLCPTVYAHGVHEAVNRRVLAADGCLLTMH